MSSSDSLTPKITPRIKLRVASYHTTKVIAHQTPNPVIANCVPKLVAIATSLSTYGLPSNTCNVLRMLIDEFVPVLKLGRRRQRLAKWMGSECFNLRRHSRRLDKQYRRTLSADDRRAWVPHERHRHQIYRRKESAYWNSRLSARLPCKKLWRTVNSMIGCTKARQSGPTVQQLLDFFNAEVDAVRKSTADRSLQSSLDPSPVEFDKFDNFVLLMKKEKERSVFI